MVTTTIYWKNYDGLKGKDEKSTVITSIGLHASLGFIQDTFVRAKEGLNPEIGKVIIET